MTEHVTDFLGPYLDGELHGPRLQQVEDHLAGCTTCRKELEELRQLSVLLQKSFTTESFMPADKFAANMVLRLSAQLATRRKPRQEGTSPTGKPLNILWWLAPVGVLGAWVFAQAVFTLGTLLSTADLTGLLGNATAWLPTASQQSLWFSATMNLFGGQLGGTSKTVLDILNGVSVTGTGLAIQLLLQAGIALAYWTWLGLWWRRRKAAQEGALPVMPLHS
jgi:predicted anti-sigma-YlaC factor YlaD